MEDTQKGNHFAENIVESLINDLLDLAKLENNSFSFTSEFFSLSQLIFDALKMLQFSAQQQEVALSAEIDSLATLDLIQAIQGDSKRYLQFLLNFLSNALKFTNQNGEIKVSIKVLEHQIITNTTEGESLGEMGLRRSE